MNKTVKYPKEDSEKKESYREKHKTKSNKRKEKKINRKIQKKIKIKKILIIKKKKRIQIPLQMKILKEIYKQKN